MSFNVILLLMDDKTTIFEIKKLQEKVQASQMPQELKEKAMMGIDRLNFLVKSGNFSVEYESIAKYVDWIISLPWQNASTDVLDLARAKQILDRNHYGLQEVKDRILEYLSILIIKKMRNLSQDKLSRAPILCLVGLVGTGKTTIAYSIAEALGRKVKRIPFGGMGSALGLRGQARTSFDAEPGQIIKALRRAGTNNPVILLDEIDRVPQDVKSDIMGVLVELLDPEQNKNFADHFIDYPFDLSNVLFIATSNNTKDISTAVLDRLEVIQMPSYADAEKTTIAKSYMFPKILQESGFDTSDIIIDENVWEDVIRPLGYDPGIRTLQRTIEGMVRKVARLMLEGKIQQKSGFRITKENVKEFIPAW